MCKNHSHFTAKIAGLLLLGPTHLIELEVVQPLEVQMPSGERWIKPSGTILYLPLSISVPLPALAHRLMEVSYIPSFNMADEEMTTMLETPTTPLDAGDYGLARYADMELSAHPERR